MKLSGMALAAALFVATAAHAQGINDAQIASIVVTANQVDVDAGKLAQGKASNAEVKKFAAQMIADHEGVNKQAVALATKLKVTPQDNDTSKALKAGVHGRKPPELSPWEYVWRLTYAPDALESLPRVHPHDVREALQLALAAEHRAESFYSDTATHARDAMVRSCAKELAEIKGHRLRQLEHLIARQKRVDWFGLRLQESEPAARRVSK